MKFRIVEDNLVTSRSGNWMVDEPERDGGDVDEYEIKLEKAEGCPYRKQHKEMWCTFYHKNKEKTSSEDIEAIGENESGEQVFECPNEMDECPIERWTSQDFWTKDDWKSYHEESSRD